MQHNLPDTFFKLLDKISPESDGPWVCRRSNKIVVRRTICRDWLRSCVVFTKYYEDNSCNSILIDSELLCTNPDHSLRLILDKLIPIKSSSKLANKIYAC
jgi:hypothetical protein